VRRGLAFALGAAVAGAVLRRAGSPEVLRRTNFRGREVTLAGGPALAVGASVGAAAGAPTPAAAAAALTAGLGAGAVGLYDDVVGARPEQKAAKGFKGHLAALREGRVTSGLVKVAGVGAAGLAASALLAADRRRASRTGLVADVLLGAGVIAGTANLLNLFDLRPGRAIKAGMLLGTPLLAQRPKIKASPKSLERREGRPDHARGSGGIAAGALGAAAGVVPDDLGERVMLGDCGANSYGALLGVAIASRTGPVGRAAVLAGLVALTAASEKVSFTQVIQSTPGLRELDALGRRP
jgi:UDP-N-acetylmuramyl pentapeptide phosphotransferase/UDP-N-acetylglucosamine-1-phosphate transferase